MGGGAQEQLTARQISQMSEGCHFFICLRHGARGYVEVLVFGGNKTHRQRPGENPGVLRDKGHMEDRVKSRQGVSGSYVH
jgi:hypothetical protein